MQVDSENYNVEEIITEVSNTFIKGEKGDKGDTGNGIKEVLRIVVGNSVRQFLVFDNGKQSLIDVEDGKGIENIELIEKNGLIDTYQIIYTDNTTSTFTVTNGEKGEQGNVGPQGPQGIQGIQGQKGDKGDAFNYDDFTIDQLEALRGPQGVQGEKGEPFKYNDFTSEQLESLRGPQGPQGIQGIQGNAGPINNITIGTVIKGDEASATLTGESPNQILNLTLPKGDIGPQGPAGEIPDTSKFIKKQDISSAFGLTKDMIGLKIVKAPDAAIEQKLDEYRPLVPASIPKLAEVIKEILNLISNTDYAGENAGIILPNNGLRVSNSNGAVQCATFTAEEYKNRPETVFISKGTLENVIQEKIGNIETLLANI